ncbi:hypothetical protein NG895_18550 [Aeoliella sp. ICT_H6.2]|uniref:Uncharacterized protein n=1 Tax=Aeoliella straminimaris TaxID=2954799 RepID=A0A9X2FGD3_9BACT|nr:hypothetical protein [Aeoliella straminimaris]MCO6045904.1 hypothetical protein [Aeoliella straminimaris]
MAVDQPSKLRDYFAFCQRAPDDQWKWHPAVLQIRTHFRLMMEAMLLDSVKFGRSSVSEPIDLAEHVQAELATCGALMLWKLDESHRVAYEQQNAAFSGVWASLFLELQKELQLHTSLQLPPPPENRDAVRHFINKVYELLSSTDYADTENTTLCMFAARDLYPKSAWNTLGTLGTDVEVIMDRLMHIY